MKMWMKRGLSLLLAVVMTLSLLPVNALAARRGEDERAETPVLDDARGEVLSRRDDERPEKPVDPDGPADLLNLSVTSITPGSDFSIGNHDLLATVEAGGDGNFAVFIIPNFTTEPGGDTPAKTVKTSPVDTFSQLYVSPNGGTGKLTSDDGLKGYKDAELPLFAAHTKGPSVTLAGSQAIKIYADGQIVFTDTDASPNNQSETAFGINALASSALKEWVESQNGATIYDADGNEITGNTLPFTIFVGGDQGYAHAPLDLPIVDSPLTVKIETKDAVMRTAFSYFATGVNANYDIGEVLFSEVTLTNNTSDDMTVNVTIIREKVSTEEPTNYGSNTDITDASGTNVRNMLPNGWSTTNTQTANTELENIYGLLGNEDTGINEKWDGTLTGNVVAAGTNAKTQTELYSITIPAKSAESDGTTTIYVAGTKGTLDATKMRNGFRGIKNASGATHTDFWSSYMITATVASGANTGFPASDTAGIRWVDNPICYPKIRLMHGADNIKKDDDKGTITDNEDSLRGPTSVASKVHKVVVRDKKTREDIELTWNVDNEYWELPANKNDEGVPIGSGIWVDGVRTDYDTIQTDQDDKQTIVQIPMGKVTIEGNPAEKLGTHGHYMWDKTAEGYGYKKVSYTYYVYGATVAVYDSNKAEFEKWTGDGLQGATDGSNVMINGSGADAIPLEITSGGKPEKVAAGQVKVTGDMTVTANYVRPLTLVTTFGGENTTTNRNNDYVYKIEISQGTTRNVALWTAPPGDDSMDKGIEEQQITGDPWKITGLDANTSYTLRINNIIVINGFKPSELPGDAEYDFVVELTGVIPVVKGSDSENDTLTLTHDGNPAREDKDVTVSGADKNDDNTIILYYPKGKNVAVKGNIVKGNTITLTYPNNNESQMAQNTVATTVLNADTDAPSWRAGNGNMNFKEPLTNHLTANFASLTATVTYTDPKGLIEVSGSPFTVNQGDSHAIQTATTVSGVTVESEYYTDDSGELWRFDGWMDPSGTTRPGAHTFTDIQKDIELVAQWTEMYRVEYDAGSKGTDPATVYVEAGNPVTLPSTTGYTGTDFTLTGWAKDGTTVGNPGGSYTPEGHVELTAVWTEQPGTAVVTVNKNDLAFTGRTVELKPDGGGANVTGPTASGGVYTFSGVPAGDYTVVVNGVEAAKIKVPMGDTVTTTVDFYEAKVSGVHGSATVSTTATTKAIGDASATAASGGNATIVVLKDSPVTWAFGTQDAHYVKDQWDNTNSHADISLDKITKETGHTANYKGEQYTVNYDGNGGTPSKASDTVTYPNKVTTLAGATRGGYTFANWWTKDGTDDDWGTQFTTSTAVTENIIVYAKWTYSITYDLNWGSDKEGNKGATPNAVSGKVSGTTLLKAPDVTADYYTLVGWYPSTDYTEADKIGVGEDVPEGTKTLYAKWDPITDKVTVNVKLDGQIKGVGKEVSVTVNGETKKVDANADATAAVLTFDVPRRTAGYDVTVAVDGTAAPSTWTVPKVYAPSSGTDRPQTADVNFYTLTVQVAPYSDNKYYGAVKQDTAAITATDYTDTKPDGVVYLEGTKVYIAARKTDDRFGFKGWDVDEGSTPDNTSATGASTFVNVGETTTLSARFGKDYFDAFLKLTVNCEDWGTANASDENIQSVQLVNGKTATASVVGVTVKYENKRWEAKQVSSDDVDDPYWRVTTVDGGVYYKQAEMDGEATEELFGVKVVDPLPIGCASATVKGGTGSSETSRVVVPRGQNVASTQTSPNNGYVIAGWERPSPTFDEVNYTGYTTSPNWSLKDNYTNDKDLVLTPTYKFKVVIRTRYNNETKNPGGAVVISDGETSTTLKGNFGTYGPGSAAGSNTVLEELDVNKTYTITVNGFESSVTFDHINAAANENTFVDVKLFKVTVRMEDKVDDNLTPDGTVGVNLENATDISGGEKKFVYLPIGATTTDEAQVHLQAAKNATSGQKFRLYNLDDPNTAGQDEILWAVAFTKPAETTKMTADVTTKTDTQIPNTLTVGGEHGMQADVTVTAYFLQQYTVYASIRTNAANNPQATETDCKSTLAVTPSGLGSSSPYYSKGGRLAEVSKLDGGSYIKVELNRDVEDTLDGWTFLNGKLYTALKDGKVDPDTEIKTDVDARKVRDIETVYFVPNSDEGENPYVRAIVRPTTYPVTVKVNLNNLPYKHEKLSVVLKPASNFLRPITMIPAHKDNNGKPIYDGVYRTPTQEELDFSYPTANLDYRDYQVQHDAPYHVTLNGAEIQNYKEGTSQYNNMTTADTDKDFNFTAYQAEGWKDDGSIPEGEGESEAIKKAALEREINYYTIKVAKTFSDNGTPTTVFANHGTTASKANEDATAGKKLTVMARSTPQTFSAATTSNNHNNSAADPYYKFNGWTLSTDTATTQTFAARAARAAGDVSIADPTATVSEYTIPAEKYLTGIEQIEKDEGIILTANFQRQYKVTVNVMENGENKLKEAATAKVSANETVANWASVNDKSVFVDAGKAALLYATLTSTNYVLGDWTIATKTVDGNEVADGEGEFTNVGHTENGANSATDKGYLFAGAEDKHTKFTPTADTTLQLNGWLKPTMSAGWSYDIGTGDKTNPKGDDKGERKSVLKPKTDSPVTVNKVYIQGGATGSAVNEDLTAGTEYTVSGNDYVMDGDYLKNNIKGTQNGINYYLHLEYALGPENHYNQASLELNSENFTIYVSKHDLTQVDIQVADGGYLTAKGATPNAGSPTANANDSVGNRDAVRYEWHEKNAIPKGQLNFTWYYASSAPTQESFKDTLGSGGVVTQTALSKAQAKLPTGAVMIENVDGGETLITAWSNGGVNIDTGTVKVTEDMKGKFIFALVTPSDEEGALGQGAVLTNAIPVDYDATVTIEKDTANNKITKDYTNYTVYLVPEGTDVTAAGWNWATALTNGTIFQATHEDGNDKVGEYTTKGSKLNANTKYYVYVNDVESGSNYVKADNTLIERAKSTKTVRYYTITLTDVDASTTVDVSADVGGSVGEVFDTTHPYPSFTAVVTDTTREVASGSTVLSGTKVTVTSSTWSQDYALTWKRSVGVDVALEDTTTTQASGATAAVYNNGTVTIATNFGGKLIQKTYNIEGNIVASGSGRILTDNDNKPTLTYKKGDTTYTFKATEVTPNGGNGGVVKFTVPRSSVGAGNGAIEGVYTLTATPVKSGDNAATLKGYRVPAGVWDATSPETTTAATASLKDLDAGTSGDALKSRFTIFIDATNLSLNVRDEETDPETNEPHGHSRANRNNDTDTGFDVSKGRHVEPAKTFGNTGLTKKITLTNDGNTTITVTPTLKKFVYDTATTTWVEAKDAGNNPWTPTVDTTAKVASDNMGQDKKGAAKVVTFSGWETVPLDKEDTHDITVTFPDNLENKDDVRYRLVFTCADGRGEGYRASAPTLWFEVELTVDPVEVDTVTTEHPKTTEHPTGDPNAYTVMSTTIKGDDASASRYGSLQKPQDDRGNTPKADNDLVYEWYTAAWDAVVTYDETTGKLMSGGKEMTKHTAGVSPDTLTYTLQDDDKGKILYLLVKGVNNATGAATTPDVINQSEAPMQLPYTGTVYVQESPKRIDTNGADPDNAPNYTVYLWNTKGGANPTADQVKAGGIPAKWVDPAAGETEGKFVADGLYAKSPATPGDLTTLTKNTYQVWANTVKGGSVLKDTGKIIDVTKMTADDVIYYSVDATKTTYDNHYVGLKGPKFFGTGDQTGATGLTPEIKVGGGTLNVENDMNWVMAGTDVDLAEEEWEKDYSLTWTSKQGTAAVKQGTDAAGGGSDAKISKIAANTIVDTELTLNLYNVEAEVTGPMGKVDYIDMTLTVGDGAELIFTTTAASGKILAMGKDASNNPIDHDSGIGVNNSAIFRLPKIDGYTAKATITDTTLTFQGYLDQDGQPKDYNETTGENATIPVNVTGDIKYVVRLQGDGLALKVSDNVPDDLANKQLATPIHNSKSGTASITPGDDAASTTKQDAKIDQTIYLNYNYDSELKVTLTAQNDSKQSPATQQSLYKVTYATTTAHTYITVKDADNPLKPGKTIAYTQKPDTNPAEYEGNSEQVIVTIAEGLPVGTHTYVGTFSFNDSKDYKTATVTYTLKVIVEPLTFSAVDTKRLDSGKWTIDTYKADRAAQGKGDSVETAAVTLGPVTPNTPATSQDPITALTQDPDYGYKWIRTEPDVTAPNIASVSAAGVLTATGGAPNYTELGTGKEYTPVATDEGKNLYLVIYGTDVVNAANPADNSGRHNATGFAVSDAKPVPYDGIVYFNKNGNPLNAQTDDPGYTVKFVTEVEKEDGATETKEIDGKWGAVTTGGPYAYVSEEGLEPGTTYTVKVSRAEGDTAHLEILGTMDGENVGKARPTDTTSYSNVAVANCFTVYAQEITAQEFKTGTGETFTSGSNSSTDRSYRTPDLTIGADKAEFTSGRSVLEGQTVTAKVPKLGGTGPDKDKGWTQDYTLNWQVKEDNDNTTGTATLADTDDKNPKKVSATKATEDDGAYSQSISKLTIIGGRLDQKTYTVVGTVKNPDGRTGGSVDSVTLDFKPEDAATDKRTFTFASYKAAAPADDATNHVYYTGKLTDLGTHVGDNVYGEVDDTATFTVVKGKYTITATEGDRTNLQYLTIGGEGDSEVDTESTPDPSKRDTVELTPAVEDDTRIFSIYVTRWLLNLGIVGGVGGAIPDDTISTMDVTTVDIKNAKQTYTFYYDGKNNTPTTAPLNLTNPRANGTGDLVVKAEVFRFETLDDVPNLDETDSNWTGGSTGAIYTDKNANNEVVLTISGLPTSTSTVLVPVGAGESSANPAKPGGNLSIVRSSTIQANAVYVVRYTSTRKAVGGTATLAEGDGDPRGPTTYYVLDLTVKPLPIEEVENPQWDDTTNAFKVTGTDFSDVTVSYKDTNTNGSEGDDEKTAAADTRGLQDRDVLYVWAKAPADVTVTKDSFVLADGADIAVSPSAAEAGVEIVGTSVSSYAPDPDSEQGMNFYLLAVRNKGTDDDNPANATGFAISEAMYAPVEVETKAYQTATTTVVPGVVINPPDPLPDGTKKKTGADNVYIVSKANKTITFTPDVTDDKTDPVDEPEEAKYYFVGWGVAPEDAATAPTTRDLTWAYPVTQKSTVIGYYDLLPKIGAASSSGYNTETGVYKTDAEEKGARTLVYDRNDGSGNIKIVFLKEKNSETDPDVTIEITTKSPFDSVPGDVFGDGGNYVLSKTWLDTNLEEGATYTYTFYDLDNGTEADGYAGYDPHGTYQIFAGEKEVVAKVDTETPWGTVKITNTNPAEGAKTSDGPSETSAQLLTYGNGVTLIAEPKAGYVFKKWTKEDEAKGTLGKDTSATTTYKGVKLPSETVTATFDKGELSMEDLTAKVIYGSQIFVDGSRKEVDAPQMAATSTASNTPGNDTWRETFKYTIATADDLPESITDATEKPGWLELDEDTGIFSITSAVNTNVKSGDPENKTYTAVDDEVVVYVIATAQSGEKTETVIKKLTIDVLRGELEINGEDFTVPDDALGGDPVAMEAFTYTSVTDQANTEVIGADNGAHTAKGTWEASPKKYIGNDRDDPNDKGDYTFTFTYGPSDDEEGLRKWNYEPASVEIKFHVNKPPQTIYIGDKIENGGAVVAGAYQTPVEDGEMTGKESDVPVKLEYATNTSRTGEKITYLDEEPIYTVRIKGEGNLYRMSLTEVKLVGFAYDNDKNEMPTLDSDWEDGQTLDFKLLLAPMPNGLWKGIHEAEFTVTGYKEEEATEGESPIPATYKLEIEILARPITKLDVTVTDEDPTPNPVIPTLDGGKTLKPDGTDDKNINPIADTKATWGPKTDGKNTQVKVDVEIDPNYVYVKGDNTTDPPTKDITETTTLTTDRPTPKPTVERDETDGDHIVHITQPIPYLMHDDVNDADGTANDPHVEYYRTVNIQQGGKVDNYTINLGAYGGDVYGVTWSVDGANGFEELGGVLTLVEPTATDLTAGGGKNTYTLNLENLDTSKPGTYVLKLKATGAAKENGPQKIESTYEFTLKILNNTPPPPPSDPCPCKVYYHIGILGTTTNSTIEDVAEKTRPSKVPTVTAVDGYVFRGWSLTNPATLKKGEQPVLVDPKTVEAKGTAMTFYAVIQQRPFHEHYVIGYPDGTFGPGDDINRASVATIIARAILPDFVEGANYGNPGNYSDVSGHWAESAIAYCTKHGVFEGMPDGTFQPNRPITRQEFALVVARLEGVIKAGEMTFTDIDDAGSWALDGIYTAYAKGWVNGYPDGTFKPLNNIRRDEAVKVFNAYLHRGVDANGLRSLHEYVYPSENNGKNLDEYRTWPDVPANHWAYYEIIEAANDHEYEAEMDGTYAVPETWNKCWIDARWGLSTAGGSAAMVSAGFQVWFH